MFAPSKNSQPDEPIRIAVVEDETLIREGLRALIGQTTGLECAFAYSNHVEAIRAAEFAPPDLALLDVTAPDTLGPLGINLWTERLPQVRIVLFDDMVRDVHIRLALRTCAAGYVTKRDPFAEWVSVIHHSLRDEPAFSETVRQRLRRTPRGWELQHENNSPGLHSLTPRETEVLSYLAQGFTGKQCSAFLGISPSTVDNHKSRIMRKLNVRKTVELTRLALREGLVPR